MSGGCDGGRDDLVEQLVQSYKTGSEAMQHVNAYEPPSMEMVAKKAFTAVRMKRLIS